MIEKIERLIPKTFLNKSGSVFYSGRDAFESPSSLYILGINPGGNIDSQKSETVKWHTNKVVREMPANWSAYRDESWASSAAGTRGMQPRVLHLLQKLNLNAGEVPASNLIFLRSSREKTLVGDFNTLAEQCWPVHQYIIDNISPRVILCFGKSVGNWVCNKMLAKELIGEFTEDNNRRWRSSVYKSGSGVKVVVATHPSIADWTSSVTDPSNLVLNALNVR